MFWLWLKKSIFADSFNYFITISYSTFFLILLIYIRQLCVRCTLGHTELTKQHNCFAQWPKE